MTTQTCAPTRYGYSFLLRGFAASTPELTTIATCVLSGSVHICAGTGRPLPKRPVQDSRTSAPGLDPHLHRGATHQLRRAEPDANGADGEVGVWPDHNVVRVDASADELG